MKRFWKMISSWYIWKKRISAALACIVVFTTVYAMVLPAITLDQDTAGEDEGIVLEEESGAEETVQETGTETEPEADDDFWEAAFSEDEDEYEEDGSTWGPDLQEVTLQWPDALAEEEEDRVEADYSVEATFGEDSGLSPNVRLHVSEIIEGTEEFEKYHSMALEAVSEDGGDKKEISYARFFDITFLTDEGEIVEPTGPVSIVIDYDDEKALTTEAAEALNVVHFEEIVPDEAEIEIQPEAETQPETEPEIQPQLMEIETEIVDDQVQSISFESQTFSVYGVVSTYTVDFHWEVDGETFEYSLAGGDSVSFRSLVEMLHVVDEDVRRDENSDADGISQFMEDIEEIRFSDESLVKVAHITEGITAGALKEELGLECEYSAELTQAQQDAMDSKVFQAPDWALISLKAFDTEESLTVEMKTGESFQIMVTDAQIRKEYISDSGETWEITVIYGEDAEIPGGSDLKVKELAAGTADYERYLTDSAKELGVEKNQISFARFFDVQIVNGNDTRIEPKSPVQVKIEYKDGVDMAAPLNIVHFAEDGTEIITDVDVNENGKEITYLQDSFSVTGTIVTLGGNTANPGKYAVIVTYEGKTYSVDSDGTLTPVSLNEDGSLTLGSEVTINNSMIWKYDGQNIYHESDAVDTDANKVASDYYYKYIDANESSGLFDENEHKDTVSTYTQTTYGFMGEVKDAKFISSRNHKNASAISYVNGHLQNTSGTRYIAVDDVDGVLHLKGTGTAGEAASVSFARVRINPSGLEVDPWKHTVNHIDIAVEGAARVSVPLAYGRYYYVKDGEEYWFDVTENTDAYWVQNVDINTDDIKSGTLEAYTDYGKETQKIADQAFYITGYSANAETDNDLPQVRIDGVFKVSMANDFTQNDYGYGGFSDNTLKKRLDKKVTYVFTTSKEAVEEQQVYWTADDGNQYPLFNMHREPLTVSGEISISSHFDYWEKGDGTENDKGNTCPPVRIYNYAWSENYWQKGGIYNDSNHTSEGFNVSGLDFRLDGNRSSSKIDLDAIEITKYIVDKEGNLIRLEDGTELTSKFTIYRNPNGNKHENPLNYDDVRDINPADSVQKGNGSMPADEGTGVFLPVTTSKPEFGGENLYTGYNSIGDPVTANIGVDGTGLVHNHNVAPGLYYIEEDKESIPSTVTDSQGNKYIYNKTFIETEYVWRSDDDQTSEYQKAVHVSSYYTKTGENDMVSIPEVLGHYRDAEGNSLNPDGSAISNGFLEFFVYNVYENVVAQIDTTKQWQDEDGASDTWKANVKFKLMKKTSENDSVTYSDVEKPDYYVTNDMEWSQTIVATADKPQAKWENLNQLNDNESYVIIEDEIIPTEDDDTLSDVVRDEESGAITSFKLNEITYYVINGEISGEGGTTINKAVPETEIEVQKVWSTPEGLSPGSATMLLYKKVGTKPSSKIQITVQADPAPVTTNAGSIRVSYTGTNKDGTAASGSFTMSNAAGWNKTFEFDRGGSYTFTYEPDGQKVLEANPDIMGEINDSTTITLTTTTAPIRDFTYTFHVPEENRPEKGSIVVSCNGVEKTANADNNWSADFQVAEGSTVRYDAVGDGKFITSVLMTSTTSAGSGETVSQPCDISMIPTVQPLTMKVPVSVNWNETPDADTEVTVLFVPDKQGVDTEQVILSGSTWSTEKVIPRLDDSGDPITWTVTSSVSSPGGTAGVSLRTPSDGRISGSGSVVVNGTVTRKMNLTVQVKKNNSDPQDYANIAEFFSLGHTRSVNSYKLIKENGWINGYQNTIKTISDLDIQDEDGNAIYYCFYIYSKNKVSTNAAEAGVGVRYNNYIYVKAQPGDVKILLEKSPNGEWQILTGQNLNTLKASLHAAPSSSRSLMKSGSPAGRLREVGVVPSTQKKFYDPEVSQEGDLPFEVVQFKDLPEDAVLVTERDDCETVINDNGTFKWNNLPSEDENGNPIYYYIVEKDATAFADTMSVKYEYTYNDDGSIKKVTITNTTTGIPEPTTGNVTVTKSFTGLGDKIPENFQIRNSYNNQVFTVSGANGTVAATGTNPYVWTITDVPDGEVITFTESGIQVGGYEMTVNGTATALAEATVSATAIKNQVVNADLVNNYVLKETDVTLKKVDLRDLTNEDPNLLKGASFTISKFTDANFQSKDETWGSSGSKTLSDEKKLDGSYTLNGEFTFEGLIMGYYQLEEVNYPSGYVRLTGNPTFKVEANASNELIITLINNPDNMLTLEDDRLTIRVGNAPGAALPSTGGPGTGFIMISGIILITISGMLLIRRKKRI